MEFPEAIFFDLDGVILDTEPILSEAWSETSKEYNYNLSQDKLHEFRGRKKVDCAKKLLEWINKDILLEDLLSTYKSKLSNKIFKAKPFKGALDLINFCIKIKLPIALVTSSSSESFKIKSLVNPWLNLFPIKNSWR